MAKEKSKGDKFSAIGKQTITQSYSAMDYYFDHLKKTIASAPSGGTEFGEKVKACAEQNISATQEFVRELSYAKDIQDMLRIQMEFMRLIIDCKTSCYHNKYAADGKTAALAARRNIVVSDLFVFRLKPLLFVFS